MPRTAINMSKGLKEGTSKCLSEEARQERDWQLSREKKEEVGFCLFPRNVDGYCHDGQPP